MNSNAIDRCGTCEYFKPNEHDLLGKCRWQPPKVLVAGTLVATYFPILHPSDWCGEFVTRNLEGYHD